MDNTMLNRFYEDNVKMTRNETSQNVEFVKPLVHGILQYVHERDKRFQIQPLNVGSYYSNLKVSRADEFDYSVVLDAGSSFSWTPEHRLIMDSMEIMKWLKHQFHCRQHQLGNALLKFQEVKRRFKALVSEAVNRPQIRQYVDAKRLSESPATTLTISHPNIVGDTISVDLAPLIKSHAPFKPEFGWPRSGARWPSWAKIEEIKAEGIHEVAKDPFYWSLSFVMCEKKLVDGIDLNGTCRKKSQRIIKKLREMWCPKGTKQELTSYHLKNILFWECENHPYDAEWTNEHISVRIVSMCYLLIQHIQRGNLPLYFHTGVNLLENKDRDVLGQVVQNIFRFLKNPEHYLT
ncbi:unnamed protein product [Mytilus coruscus]|uniref:Uncharacterized protein n=1 Tax=Mytilus coruscus TaxID=42192 RepID=A0A6J8CNS2_MYTCO|nr:unnamed protein product [Mytilus coruscus]